MIDFVTLWPTWIDYPLFRFNLPQFLKQINTLYIHFTPGIGYDIENYIRTRTDYKKIQHIDKYVNYTGEWADYAYKQFLKQSNSEWFGIIHQDLLIKDYDKLFLKVKEVMEEADLIGVHYMSKQKETLIQPIFFLCKRESYEKTSKDFSATSMLDTCGRLSAEMEQLKMKLITFDDLGLIKQKDYYHISGTTQNYRNFLCKDVFHKPNIFLAYNYFCQQLPIETHPQFLQIEKQITAKFGAGAVEFLQPFFPKEGDEI